MRKLLWRILSALAPDGWAVYDTTGKSGTSGQATLLRAGTESPIAATVSDAVTYYVPARSRQSSRTARRRRGLSTGIGEAALLSEAALAKVWLTQREDEAWRNL